MTTVFGTTHVQRTIHTTYSALPRIRLQPALASTPTMGQYLYMSSRRLKRQPGYCACFLSGDLIPEEWPLQNGSKFTRPRKPARNRIAVLVERIIGQKRQSGLTTWTCVSPFVPSAGDPRRPLDVAKLQLVALKGAWQISCLEP